MTYSALASSTGVSPKRGSREGARIDTFLVHHMAGVGGAGVTEMMRASGGRTVSANYTIHTDGSLHGVVPEEDRAWTSGAAGDGGRGAAWDRRSITVEIANETGDPSWRISDAALRTAAALLNDLRSRYQIENVLGHRDLYQRYGASYPTYCPGPETVDSILALAAASDDSAGGGGGDDEMTPAQEAKLDRMISLMTQRVGPHNETVAEGVARLLKRQGGSVKQQTITATVSEGRDAAKWTKARVKGSVNGPSVTAMLQAIQEAVTGNDADAARMILDRAAVIDLTLDVDETPEYDDEDVEVVVAVLDSPEPLADSRE